MRPPFIANPDGHRCLQCTLLMALRALKADQGWTLDDVDVATYRRPGEGTWTHAAYLALAARPQVEALAIDPFDYERFAQDPLLTVLDTFPRAVAETLANGFDLVAAAALAHRLIEERPIPLEQRSPTLEDVRRLIDADWLVIANVNAAALAGDEGVVGHSLLLFSRSDAGLIAHDPGSGSGGQPDRCIDETTFEGAWSFMGEHQRELLAVRRARRTQD